MRVPDNVKGHCNIVDGDEPQAAFIHKECKCVSKVGVNVNNTDHH